MHDHLGDAARRRGQRTYELVRLAVDAMVREGAAVDVRAVARRAKRHHATIYRRPDLLALVEAGGRKLVPVRADGSGGPSAESLAADLANERALRVRLEEANRALHRRLSEALGLEALAEAGLELPEVAPADPQEVAELRRRVGELEGQLSITADALRVARALNHRLEHGGGDAAA